MEIEIFNLIIKTWSTNTINHYNIMFAILINRFCYKNIHLNMVNYRHYKEKLQK